MNTPKTEERDKLLTKNLKREVIKLSIWVLMFQFVGIGLFLFVWWGLSKLGEVPFLLTIIRGKAQQWNGKVFPDGELYAGTTGLYALVAVTFAWSLFGSIARAEDYLLERVLWPCVEYWQKYRNKALSTTSSHLANPCEETPPLHHLARAISGIYLGVAVANVLVIFMVYTNILGLSLADAGPGSIAALSFILGFFPRDAVAALGEAMGYIRKLLKRTSSEELCAEQQSPKNDSK